MPKPTMPAATAKPAAGLKTSSARHRIHKLAGGFGAGLAGMFGSQGSAGNMLKSVMSGTGIAGAAGHSAPPAMPTGTGHPAPYAGPAAMNAPPAYHRPVPTASSGAEPPMISGSPPAPGSVRPPATNGTVTGDMSSMSRQLAAQRAARQSLGSAKVALDLSSMLASAGGALDTGARGVADVMSQAPLLAGAALNKGQAYGGFHAGGGHVSNKDLTAMLRRLGINGNMASSFKGTASGLGQMGGMAQAHPYLATAGAAGMAAPLAYGAYRGGKAILGGKDEEKTGSANLMDLFDRWGEKRANPLMALITKLLDAGNTSPMTVGGPRNTPNHILDNLGVAKPPQEPGAMSSIMGLHNRMKGPPPGRTPGNILDSIQPAKAPQEPSVMDGLNSLLGGGTSPMKVK